MINNLKKYSIPRDSIGVDVILELAHHLCARRTEGRAWQVVKKWGDVFWRF